MLQWGRDLLIAETPVKNRSEERWKRLQWGRDLLIAETAGW